MASSLPEHTAPDSVQYNITQLAELTMTSIRNIRAYQEKGILPSPVKRGRIAIYNESHAARLQLIQQLLNRGYSSANIAEMLHAHEQGHNLNQLMGLDQAVATLWTEETPLYLSIAELSTRFSTPPSAEDIQYAFEVGVLEPAGADQVKISHAGLLQLGTVLVDYQFSFRQLLDIVVMLRQRLNVAANSVAEIGFSIIFPDNQSLPVFKLADVTELVQHLRPLFAATVATELNNAMARSLQQQMTQHMISHVLKKSGDSS